jgi:cysteinyl-tRNA synthetase
VTAIDDDLDLPTAIAVVRETVRSPDLSPDERRWLLLDADLVLGLDLDRTWDTHGDPSNRGVTAALSPDAASLLDARSAARDAHDWGRADALRDELAALGVEVVDGPDGTTWRRRTP